MLKINTNNFYLEFERDLYVTNKEDFQEIKYLLKCKNAFFFIQRMSTIFHCLAYPELYPNNPEHAEYLKDCRIDIKNFNPKKLLEAWEAGLISYDIIDFVEEFQEKNNEE